MGIQDLYDKPGYQIRRLRQIAAAIFAAEAADFEITSQQWTALEALRELPGLDQNALCEVLSLDRGTMATLLARIEERGLVRRSTPANDRRRKHVVITARGKRLLDAMKPAVARVQDRILAPLSVKDRSAFQTTLKILVDTHAGTHSDETTRDEAS